MIFTPHTGAHSYFRKPDIYLALIAGFFLITSTWLLVDDKVLFQLDRPQVSNSKVAEIRSPKNDVRRKNEEDLLWRPIYGGDSVYQFDSIFTGENSETEIALQDHSRLILNPKSLVFISTDARGDTFEIQSGTLSGFLGSRVKIELRVAGKRQLIQGSNSLIQVSKKADGSSKISVLSGEAKLSVGTHETLLHSNQETRVTPQGVVENVRSFTIQLNEPALDSVIWFNGGSHSIHFLWKVTDGQTRSTSHSPVRFQISRDEDFITTVYQEDTRNSEILIPSFPQRGSFYWRVCASSSSGECQGGSSIGRFYISEETPPLLLNPADHSILDYPKVDPDEVGGNFLFFKNSPRPGLPVTLRWKIDVPGEFYQLQISHDKVFQNSLLDQRVKGPLFESPVLPKGKYYWRVRVKDDHRVNSLWSRVGSFEIAENELPDPPLPSSPQSSEKIHSRKIPFRLNLAWEPRLGTKYYFLEVAKNKDFSQIIFKNRTRNLSLEVEIPSYGSYYWRVRATTESGAQTEFSSPVSFDLVEYPPTVPASVLAPVPTPAPIAPKKKIPLPAPKIPKQPIEFETSQL